MSGPKMARFWQGLGVLFILMGLYVLAFERDMQGIIYLGGGSAMFLLLGRTKPKRVDDLEIGS